MKRQPMPIPPTTYGVPTGPSAAQAKPAGQSARPALPLVAPPPTVYAPQTAHRAAQPKAAARPAHPMAPPPPPTHRPFPVAQPKRPEPPPVPATRFGMPGPAPRGAAAQPSRPPHPGRLPAAPPVPPSAGAAGTIQRSKLFDREFTFYTYMQTDPNNQLGIAKQGPHTLSFSFNNMLVNAATGAKDLPSLQNLFDTQVPDKTEMKKLVDEEMKESALPHKALKIKRFHADYGSHYDNIKKHLAGKKMKFAPMRKLIRKIMEMHPYGTYAYKTAKGASKKSLGGKNERTYLAQVGSKNMTNASKLMDLKSAKFKHKAKLQQYLRMRLKMAYNNTQINNHFKL